MCDFQTLYYGSDGYIIVCNHCNNFQIAFHSTLLTLSAADYSRLYELIRKSCEDYCQDIAAAHQKSIFIPTPQEGFGMLLTAAEAMTLLHQFETADTVYKTQELLDLFR